MKSLNYPVGTRVVYTASWLCSFYGGATIPLDMEDLSKKIGTVVLLNSDLDPERFVRVLWDGEDEATLVNAANVAPPLTAKAADVPAWAHAPRTKRKRTKRSC
jgi:hypothetical protein